MFALTNQVAVVTGASRGIGRAIAIAFAKQGARVVINYAHREDEAKCVADEIVALKLQLPVLKRFDVSSSSAVDAAFQAIKDELGTVDILVNNAGIAINGLLLRVKDADWQQVLRVNLDGAFYCARACSKIMVRARRGRIINLSSVVGESGNAGQVAYAASKSGLIGLTKSLAQELASRQITVNAITPGYIETDMTAGITPEQQRVFREKIPLDSIGTPDDIAHAAVFLASDEGRYITGHVLAVNGGLYM